MKNRSSVRNAPEASSRVGWCSLLKQNDFSDNMRRSSLVPRVVPEPLLESLSQETSYPGTEGYLLWRVRFYRDEVSNGFQRMVSIYRNEHFIFLILC